MTEPKNTPDFRGRRLPEGQSLAGYLRELGVPEASEQEYAEREGQTDSYWRVNGLPEPPDAA